MCTSLGLLKLRLFVAKLQRSIALLSPATFSDSGGGDDDMFFEALSRVPEDVREGHFAVLAVMDSESKRFVVEIERLSCPEFARLLDRAEEEFGFNQIGAISIPCCPEEFQKLLDRSF